MYQVRGGSVPRCPTSPASHCARGVPHVLLGAFPKELSAHFFVATHYSSNNNDDKSEHLSRIILLLNLYCSFD